jgi:hypothetical protein
VPLQRVTVTVPGDAPIGGLTFVLRSEDSTRWYRDADTNFFVPLPTRSREVEKSAVDDRCGQSARCAGRRGRCPHCAPLCGACWALPA